MYNQKKNIIDITELMNEVNKAVESKHNKIPTAEIPIDIKLGTPIVYNVPVNSGEYTIKIKYIKRINSAEINMYLLDSADRRLELVSLQARCIIDPNGTVTGHLDCVQCQHNDVVHTGIASLMFMIFLYLLYLYEKETGKICTSIIGCMYIQKDTMDYYARQDGSIYPDGIRHIRLDWQQGEQGHLLYNIV